MGILSQLWVEIGSDKTKLDSGLIAAKAQITDFAAKSNSLLGTLGIGLSAAGLVKFIADASKKGSDLMETMNKVKQVFGESTSSVTAMAESMASQFGSVKTVTLDAATNFGLLALGAGLSAKQAAEMSTKLVRLADDASSFYNVPLDVALEKIRSGLVGEAEPLRAFGVFLSENAVKEQALADGAKLVNGELTEQDKVLARVTLTTKGLSKAQGDHVKTMDEYAGKMRELAGRSENFLANIGAGMAGAQAWFIANVEKKSIMDAIGAHVQAVWQAGVFQTGGGGIFQQAADVAAGVKHGMPIPSRPAAQLPFEVRRGLQLMREAEPKMGAIYQGGTALNNLGIFGMGGGLGGIAGAMNMAGMQVELDAQIKGQRAKMSAWGGAHVMDSESFMKQAQERILKPEDETQKQQLAELIKAREGIDKLVGKQEGRQKVGGVILRGRES